MAFRKISRIVSQRRYENYASYSIVSEWEDVLSKKTGLKIYSEPFLANRPRWFCEKFHLVHIYHWLALKSDLQLRFIMQAEITPHCYLTRNTIPVIIDFWIEDNQLEAFYKTYESCPLVLITSAEVFEYLKDHSCPLPIEHWPLSYPDSRRYDPNIIPDKEYEFCVFGRPNPFFIRLLDEYCVHHPDFTYIHTEGDENCRKFIDKNNNIVCIDTGRESYLKMISKTKISCYSTPGIDESKKETGRFNQVTPRLFEMLSNGCSVIGHYPENADTRYYKLSDIIPNVEHYFDFEIVLDKLRKRPLSPIQFASFLGNHYTSTRVKLLRVLLNKHGIELL